MTTREDTHGSDYFTSIFLLPQLCNSTDEASQQKIIEAGQGVLAARDLHPERSLAEHYNPLAMDPELVKAHNLLDDEVDQAFGAQARLSHERERQELLFERYVELTTPC